MCLDCYPDRCFTYACKNASHCTPVSVPAWCCTVKRKSWYKRAFCPVFTAALCSSLETWRVSHTLPPFSHSLSHMIQPMLPGGGLQQNCGSAPPHPPSISSLSPSYCICDDNTPILPWPNPHTLFVLPLLIFSFCSSFGPFPPLPFQPPCSLSLSGEISAVLYIAVTLKAAFIRFILRWWENGMVSLHYTQADVWHALTPIQ